jgi:hypothetical protein
MEAPPKSNDGRDILLQDVQHRGHVLPDTGLQQREDPAVGSQLRDLPHDYVVDVGSQRSATGGQRASDLCGALGNGWTCSVHRPIVRRWPRLSQSPAGMARCRSLALIPLWTVESAIRVISQSAQLDED